MSSNGSWRKPRIWRLPEKDRTAIFNFTFLWSLFEAQIMSNFARADVICAKVDEWRAADTLNTENYDVELAYFRSATSRMELSRITSGT